MRKLAVVGAVIGMLLWTQAVRAQCTGYSANVTPLALSPAEAAQRGQVTATLTITANGGVPSHNLTTTAGTQITLAWTSANGSTATLKTATGGSWSWSLSGNLTITTTSGGNKWTFIVTDANGNTTQDQVNLSIVSGAPGTIVYQDELPTNAYIQVTINFGGGSMMNNCTECNTNPRACVNATHTPYVTMTAVNHTSGESQSLARQQAGNIAKSNESVSGSGSIFISALPGDTVDGIANGEIFCTMFGNLPVSGNDEWGLEWELAWTKFSTIQSTCLPTGDSTGSIGCKVTWKYMCNTNSQPPDLQPTIVFAEFDTNGNPVTLETVPPFWWGWGFGIRGHISAFTTPWIFPANVLQQYTRGHYLLLDISAGAFPSNSTIRNCTNKDKGTKPEIFPPFDQPL